MAFYTIFYAALNMVIQKYKLKTTYLVKNVNWLLKDKEIQKNILKVYEISMAIRTKFKKKEVK